MTNDSQIGRPSRPRDAAATRQALLDAARARFARDGYFRTGVREIAADAGVDPALISRYFGSKEKLFAAVWDQTPEEAPPSKHPDPIGRTLDYLLDPRPGAITITDLLHSSGNRQADELIQQRLSELRDQIAAAPPQADVDPDEARLRATVAVAWILGIAVMRDLVNDPVINTAAPADVRAVIEARLRDLMNP